MNPDSESVEYWLFKGKQIHDASRLARKATDKRIKAEDFISYPRYKELPLFESIASRHRKLRREKLKKNFE